MSDYLEFLEKKRHSVIDSGIKITESALNDYGMFDYQQYAAYKSISKGRFADFIDTGLGKTIIQLVIADIYAKHFNRPVLILTPLAVAFQFVLESEKFNINDVQYSKDGAYKGKIIICNYERLNKFNHQDFCAVICDESSILKNFDGKIKEQITSFMKKVDYRYLFTATPSPNDFIELGTSSEALGHMGYMDMLSKFFTNNQDSIDPNKIGVKWVLKSHAERHFFDWVSSWSLSMRKPSDLGFNDDRHILPELKVNHHKVYNDSNLCVNNQWQLIPAAATRLTEVREEQKATIEKRCEMAVNLTSNHDTSVYWCNFNKEAELLLSMDNTAYEVKGSMNLDKKEEILLAFAKGEIKKLITKPKITSFGLNWQHCNHTVYFPTFSYEQYYQSIRRFWRFGQKNPVTVDLVYSDGQEKVIQSLESKTKKANQLFNKLNQSINNSYTETKKDFNQSITLPSFL